MRPFKDRSSEAGKGRRKPKTLGPRHGRRVFFFGGSEEIART